ncbi:Cytochrome P450 [Dillenia turbinata]|uniref:Cytochrome P450 n=1 Tax=Dillenia turbinata TaxID=194707 RepID=A0AAN8Z539_9MAGN
MAMLPLVLQQYSVDLQVTPRLTPHILCLLFLSLLLLLRTPSRGTKYNLPPSPPKLPLLGNFHLIGSLPYRSLQALSDRYGPLMLIHEGRVRTLVVSSPEMAREVLKTQDVNFSNKYVSRGAGVMCYEGHDILISPHGQRWMELRKLCVSELLTQKKVQSFQDIREEIVAHVVANIQQSCLKKEPVNLSVMSTTAANNIACRCILGQRYEGMGGLGFGRLAKKVTKLFVSFSFRELFPYMGWMDRITGFDTKLEKIFKLVDGFLDRAIKEHKRVKNDNENKVFIEALLNLKKASVDGGDLTQETIKGVLLLLQFPTQLVFMQFVPCVSTQDHTCEHVC